ncbi:hypothetical protein Tco_0965550 [Tanacetum coccineum]
MHFFPTTPDILVLLKFSQRSGLPDKAVRTLSDVVTTVHQADHPSLTKQAQVPSETSEEVSDPDALAPKPAKATKPKATKQSKPLAPKAAQTKVKKHKLVKESSETPSPAKRPKAGKFGDEEADMQKVVEESLKDVHAAHQGPLPPVVIREPEFGKKFNRSQRSGWDQTFGITKSRMAGWIDTGVDEVSPQYKSVVLAGPNLTHGFECIDASTQQNPVQIDEGLLATAYPMVQREMSSYTVKNRNEKTLPNTEAESDGVCHNPVKTASAISTFVVLFIAPLRDSLQRFARRCHEENSSLTHDGGVTWHLMDGSVKKQGITDKMVYLIRCGFEKNRNYVIAVVCVVRIEVFSLYGYDYMKTIVLRRADLNEYIIAERDFKYLYPSDFEDLYLLNLQGYKYGVFRWICGSMKIHKFSYFLTALCIRLIEAVDYWVRTSRSDWMNPWVEHTFWTRKGCRQKQWSLCVSIQKTTEDKEDLTSNLDSLLVVTTQREAQQANELSNLTRQRQLLASVNYRRAIIEELERLPGNLVAYKTREHLKRIQKAVLVEVIELKKELRLQVPP